MKESSRSHSVYVDGAISSYFMVLFQLVYSFRSTCCHFILAVPSIVELTEDLLWRKMSKQRPYGKSITLLVSSLHLYSQYTIAY